MKRKVNPMICENLLFSKGLLDFEAHLTKVGEFVLHLKKINAYFIFLEKNA